MTASPGLTYSNDILGNRLSNSSTSNGWDQLCRMTSFTSGSTTTNYTYRSDGMRALKAVASGNSTSFAYDGQMGFEDVDAGPNAAVTDYAIGARGIDRLAKTSGGTTSVGYPIYDGHGNMVSTLSESGASYSVGNGRQYDVWGNILNSDGSGDPKGRYCANLGHKQDDESGLIYMRARYCDPLVGRFVSEDPDRQGSNCFCYCADEPANSVDSTGRDFNILSAFWDAIMPLLSSLGLKGLVTSFTGLAVKLGAYALGFLLAFVGRGLASAGYALCQYAKDLDGSGSAGGSLAASAAGYCGAQALALGLDMEGMGMYLMCLGADLPDEGGDDLSVGEPPEDGDPVLTGGGGSTW